ncbi:MAG: hypothetical protein KA401_04985 [Anaerolineae bacterium]|nr:hypothetical protein [Chloroflexota bacterium]MBP6298679.1 hypothetical protein [Anaerolineae bacterium]
MQRSPNNQTSLPTRNGLTIVTPKPPPPDRRPYLFGVIGGLFAGLLGAYFFDRASNENPEGRQPVSTGQIFSIALALLTVLRQIAEMGRPPQKK